MDTGKRTQLKARLSREPEPQVVPIEVFFDGNDDVGSIGCNLIEHPGIDTFREAFARVAKRSDVVVIYAQIAEFDPGDDYWPFTDTVFVVGSISADELAHELALLKPDEVSSAEDFGIPEALAQRHNEPILAAWWD
ncbi:MAG TPA: hypothetical protein VED01_03865 [Burkholderiales bacterium]|nr:hypothetical protein [Burkholderiales bacterium]